MCKKSEYGNCDEETKDNEYCIFHKPDKNEEEVREFYRKFLERFKPVREKVKIEEFEVERFVFESNVDCRGYVFPEIHYDVDFKFEYAVFEKEVRFEGATFGGDVSFWGATFGGIVTFTDEQKKETCKPEKEKYRFYGKLNFSSITFRTINIDLPSECFKHPKAEAEACRVQRISYEKEGKRDNADKVFVRERKALRRWEKLKAKEKLKKSKNLKSKIVAAGTLLKAYAGSAVEFALADLTCEYGTDWKRPVFLWIILVGFIFPITYCLTHSVSGIHGAKIGSIWNCLYFSVVTATTLGYGDLHPVGWGKAIASAEAIFGMFMWAVFLAVFSRKYMR